MAEGVDHPYKHLFLCCSCGVTPVDLFNAVWLFLGLIGHVVGAEDKFDTVKEVAMGLREDVGNTLVKVAEVVHVDIEVLEHMGKCGHGEVAENFLKTGV